MQNVRDINYICTNCFSTLDAHRVCPRCGKRAIDEQQQPGALPLRSMLSGRYIVGTPLGRGGFGITYKAYDTLTGKIVAIKEFFPKGYTKRLTNSCAIEGGNSENGKVFNYWLSAFIQEAKVLTSIKHLDGIVSIHDFFLTNNTAYIVMEYLNGMSLHRFINGRGGRLNLTETLNIMRPVIETLLRLHQYGMIHKDISPENIQIVDNHAIKLIDFGAASLYTQNVQKPFFVLKKGYSPIELYSQGGAQGPWTDIYELAATIYTCIVGNPPPEATERRLNDKLVPPSSLNIKIQPVREKSLLKALSLYPKDRYSNIAAFQQMFYGEFLPNTTLHTKTD
ncbi:MAG: serine/threonine protein kinase [Clostridiales bacterium]|nr:serine/threonine protein kinase [Clostridiales bacterium]